MDPRTAPSRPRLCFAGPLPGAVHPGVVVTQGVRLSGLFRAAGYPVVAVSTSTSRFVRLAEIAGTLLTRGRGLDVLIVHTYGGRSFVVEDTASAIGSAWGVPVVFLLHGGALPEFVARHPRWARRVFGRAAMIVAPSPYLARTATGLGLRSRVIPNVIEAGRYPSRERRVLRPRLFWMRTFDPDYNPFMALEVLRRVRERHPDAALVMGGEDKGMRSEVMARAKELGLSEALELPGFLDLSGKIRCGEACDIFLNTSHYDNMPVAVVEAAAMGLPVVSTAVGGVPDLLTDGETGLLIPDGDAAAMSAAVLRLLAEPELAGRLSRNGRNLALRSDWAAVRGQWEDLFASLRNGRSAGNGRGARETA
jgi:glycosyltransferase involved in cell wall biosynthesis